MKKIMLFIVLSFAMFSVNAQNQRNLVLISGSQENFIVSIDQSRVNTHGMNEVAITGLDGNYYSVTIRFANHHGRVFNANLYVPPMSEIVYEVYPADGNNPDGTYFIRDIYPAPARAHVQNPYAIFPYGNGGYVQNQTHTETHNTQSNQVNINIINNVGQPAPTSGYGQGDCATPVSPERFEDMLRRVGDQMMSDDKLRIAKQIVKTNCITSYQLTQMMETFSFDNARLKLAKYAYNYVYDLENFYKVTDALIFFSNKEKLEEYVSEHG